MNKPSAKQTYLDTGRNYPVIGENAPPRHSAPPPPPPPPAKAAPQDSSGRSGK